MILKSYLKNINFPENVEFNFKLAGPVGTGELCISYVKDGPERYLVHVALSAGLKMLPEYRFEGLSTWEKENNEFNFVSYEEKDFSKKIHKKYEIIPEGLNYMENKKGVILEREVQYFSYPENMTRIFDPMSAATLVPMEIKNEDRTAVCIFGKQRIIQLEVSKSQNTLRIEKIAGTNDTWNTVLASAHLLTNEDGMIQSIEVPAPLGLGKLKMNLGSKNQIEEKKSKDKVKGFFRDF